MKNFGSRNKRKKTSNLMERREFPGSVPEPEKTSADAMLYNVIAFRGLDNVGNIEVKADPNSSIIKGGYPYAIIAKTNKVVEANYAGRDNIEGNILTRLQNSNDSKLLNIFDVLTMNFRTNYLYLCYSNDEVTNHNNLAVNMEMNKAFNEALSKAYSTMTTQLPYYTDKIVTSLPVPPTYTDAETDIYHKLGGLLHYQAVLQNAMAPISKYIETMSLENTVLDMSFRRESPSLTALFGLFRKSAFKATLNAIGTTIIGEYFDVNWYQQMNTLANIPSRKSNSMTDPLMTASMTTFIPSCQMSASDVTYYDSDTSLKAKGIWLNPDTWTFDGTKTNPVELSFEQIIYRLVRMLDVSTMLTWARMVNTNPASVGSITTPSAYYEEVNRLVEHVNMIMTTFTTSMTNIRTFINKLESSGMVYWKKGMAVNVDHINQYEPVFNVILHNMIACYIGGSAKMTFDKQTQRWQASTLWNKYTGIAQFDKISGGSFLTFGLRKLDLGGLQSTDTAMCLPIMFATELNTGSSKCVMTNRMGVSLNVTGVEVASLEQDAQLSRLDPLNVKFPVKIPTVTILDKTNKLTKAAASALVSSVVQLLLTVVGYCNVKLESGGTTSACDPDFICFLDIQISDVSNDMIQFCRNYSPFRVMTPNGKRTIGFGSK